LAENTSYKAPHTILSILTLLYFPPLRPK